MKIQILFDDEDAKSRAIALVERAMGRTFTIRVKCALEFKCAKAAADACLILIHEALEFDVRLPEENIDEGDGGEQTRVPAVPGGQG